jgi:phage terminase Nu1 subunit (DNA packaging protein)
LTPTSRGLAVSRRQCCDITGWSPNTFDNAVREGMPVAERPSGRGTDWIVFMGDVIRWIVEQELRAAGHDPGKVVKLDGNAEKARLLKEQADKTELENQLARKELVRASDVAKADEVVMTTLRDRVMAVLSVAPLLSDAAKMEGLPKVRSVLRDALADALKKAGSVDVPELELAS